jgi:phosphatidylglycerol lysyltransferase
MRANSSDPQDTVTAEHPIKPERLRLLDRLSKYRQPIGLAVTLLLFAIALIACRHLLAELDLDALHDSILDVPKPALLGAFGATVVGFIILLGYEWSASRYAGVTLPPRTLALGGFTAFAIGNAIGLSLLSGGSVRYRLYARLGLGRRKSRT